MLATISGYAGFLVLLGIVGYLATGMASLTALIPAAFGVVFFALAALAKRKRKLAMHIAVVLAVLAIGGSAPGVSKMVAWAGGQAPARPAAVIAQALMCVASIGFVVAAVRSFIAARRAA